MVLGCLGSGGLPSGSVFSSTAAAGLFLSPPPLLGGGVDVVRVAGNSFKLGCISMCMHNYVYTHDNVATTLQCMHCQIKIAMSSNEVCTAIKVILLASPWQPGLPHAEHGSLYACYI